MDLWIRSQDGGLYEMVGFRPPLCCDDTKPNGMHAIIGICYGYRTMELGVYKTKERALEVLDEIQEVLNSKTIITDTGNPIECSDGGFVYLNQKTKLEYMKVGTYVYEMPEE